MPKPAQPLMTAEEFEALAKRLIGTRPAPAPVNMDVREALRAVTYGRVVSLGEGPAQPEAPRGSVRQEGEPTPYSLTQWTEAGDGWIAVNDRLSLDIHGAPSMTHIDTTAHFSWEATPRDPQDDPLLEMARTGIIGRGVLIDVPGVLATDVEGKVITLDQVRETLERTGLEVRAGDILHINLGRREPARSDIPLGAEAVAGLSIECAEWLCSFAPAAVVTDQGLDPLPSEVEGLPVPWHVLLLAALHIPLVDRAMLQGLSQACRDLAKWDFLSVIAPLPIPGASGSPVNPMAIL